jgi:4-hydroxy-3-methylbut-2-enyl diphosphate reductase IspH
VFERNNVIRAFTMVKKERKLPKSRINVSNELIHENHNMNKLQCKLLNKYAAYLDLELVRWTTKNRMQAISLKRKG